MVSVSDSNIPAARGGFRSRSRKRTDFPFLPFSLFRQDSPSHRTCRRGDAERLKEPRSLQGHALRDRLIQWMRWEGERFANAEGDKTGFLPGPLKGAIMREKSHPIPNTPPRTPHYTNHAMYTDEYREILR